MATRGISRLLPLFVATARVTPGEIVGVMRRTITERGRRTTTSHFVPVALLSIPLASY